MGIAMKKFIKYLLSVIVLCTLIILIKSEFSLILLKHANYGMPVLIEQGTVDNLFIGSSMFRQGIDIDYLEENKETNYVLSYNGNQPILEYYQLKYLIDHDVSIRNLYVDMYAYAAWSETKVSDEKLFMEIGIEEKWKLWKILSKGKLAADMKTFWELFVTSNNEIIATWPVSGRIVNSLFYKGGSTSKPVASSESVLNSMSVPAIKGEMNNTQRTHLIKLINLAKENGINIVFIESPKYCNMAENESYICAMRQYMNLLDEESVEYILCESTWNLTGANDNIMKYPYNNKNVNYYVDNGHLSYEGRIEFTKQILQVVSK